MEAGLSDSSYPLESSTFEPLPGILPSDDFTLFLPHPDAKGTNGPGWGWRRMAYGREGRASGRSLRKGWGVVSSCRDSPPDLPSREPRRTLLAK
jgi:hypothetical protein